MAKSIFECEVCGRCGGCGRYSYNQIDGDKCYGCNGTGWRLTKRGAAARAFYRAMLETKAGALKVGDMLWFAGGPLWKGQFAEITEIGPTEKCGASLKNGVWIDCFGFTVTCRAANGEAMRYGGLTADHLVTIKHPTDFIRDCQAKALAYQASLTKAGTVAKSKAA